MTISVMIIDDNETDRYLLQRHLGKCSFPTAIFEATDGQAALEFFSEHEKRRASDPDKYPPIIIFLDINMPRLDGFEFLEQFAGVRTTKGLTSTVVVMFTSSPSQSDRDRSFSWDFVKDFIIKGEFSSSDLEQLIPRLAKV